mgnify:CR=1 FL=1
MAVEAEGKWLLQQREGRGYWASTGYVSGPKAVWLLQPLGV